MTNDNHSPSNLLPILSMVLRRPETILTWVIVIGMMVIGTETPFLPFLESVEEPLSLFWLIIIGMILQLLLFYGALKNPSAYTELRFARECNPKTIHNSQSREQLQEALTYRRSMLDLISNTRGAMRSSLTATLEDIKKWIRYMHDLAQRIDFFEGNELVQKELLRIPGQIREVENQINNEVDDEKLQDDLQARRERLQLQLDHLTKAERSVRRAKITLQNTRVSLGTIYAQMTHLATKSSSEGFRAANLREDIRDEVNKLSDVLETMEEIHSDKELTNTSS